MAKVLKRGGNFLILDEPTNDLDLSSLRLLEEALSFYPGCVLAVSHDRYFLNRICTGVLTFEKGGELVYTPGDYDYALEKRRERERIAAEAVQPVKSKPVPAAPAAEKLRPAKLSYKEQRELETIEEKIAAAEEKISELENIFGAPDFYAKYGAKSAELQSELDAARQQASELYDRWEFLENKRAALA